MRDHYAEKAFYRVIPTVERLAVQIETPMSPSDRRVPFSRIKWKHLAIPAFGDAGKRPRIGII